MRGGVRLRRWHGQLRRRWSAPGDSPTRRILGYNIGMRFTASAAEHGATEEAITHVIDHAVVGIRISAERILFLGPDPTGRVLEVIAAEVDDGLLVFHAMPISAKYRRYLP